MIFSPQSGEELMLIPQEEASPAVTLKMSIDPSIVDLGNSENVAPLVAQGNNSENVVAHSHFTIVHK